MSQSVIHDDPRPAARMGSCCCGTDGDFQKNCPFCGRFMWRDSEALDCISFARILHDVYDEEWCNRQIAGMAATADPLKKWAIRNGVRSASA